MVARIVRAKIFDHAHFRSNHAHFGTIEGCYKLLSQCNQEFLDERTNSKSSRVHLAALIHILTHNQA